jgi:hypothetical protein
MVRSFFFLVCFIILSPPFSYPRRIYMTNQWLELCWRLSRSVIIGASVVFCS